MKYLVTGGAGFIGSHIVAALVQRGEQVRVLDNFDSGQRQNLAPVLSKIELMEGDIRDMPTVQRALQGVDYVLHQAALRSVPKSLGDPIGYHAVNVTGTLHLLQAARAVKVQRVVVASSSSVYGETDQLPEREDQTPAPISPYAATKLADELYCQLYTRAYGVPTVCLRYFNVFGPRQSLESEYAVVVPKFITNLLKGEAPPIHGDGAQSRDFTFVEDVVAANLQACVAEHAAGEAFNIAGGQSHSVLELAETLNRILGTTIPPKLGPVRPGDVKHTLADISKAARLLGWRPAVSFEEGLRRTAAWYRSVGKT